MTQEREIHIGLVTYALHVGGMENFIFRIGTSLLEAGYKVEVITTEEPGEWFGRAGALNLPARHIPGVDWAIPVLHALKVGRFLRKANYDVIFLCHARFAQASLGMLADKTIVIPVLLNDCQDIFRVGFANEEAWNVLVSISQRLDEKANRCLPGRPVVFIPPGAKLPSADLLQSRRPPQGRMRCIYAGRLEHAQKGIFFLPDILQKCLEAGTDIFLTIAGDGPDREALAAKFASQGLGERIEFCGTVTHERFYELLCASHVFIFPSFFEGLPLALLETLTCGCVPVASRLPGTTDMIVDDGSSGFLLEVGDIGGFANAIGKLQRDPDRWSAMSEAGRAKVAESFSLEAMGRAYVGLVERALSGTYPLPRSRRSLKRLDLNLFAWRELIPNRICKALEKNPLTHKIFEPRVRDLCPYKLSNFYCGFYHKK